MTYDHKLLETWRRAITARAGWQVEERHRMRRGRLNSWKSTMCRHPQIMKGRWRAIGHLPNPAYSLRDCIQLESQLLSTDLLRQIFVWTLTETLLYDGGVESDDGEGAFKVLKTGDEATIKRWFEVSVLTSAEVYAVMTCAPAHRLRAMVETLDLVNRLAST